MYQVTTHLGTLTFVSLYCATFYTEVLTIQIWKLYYYKFLKNKDPNYVSVLNK